MMLIKKDQIYYNEQMNTLFLLDHYRVEITGRMFDFSYETHFILELINDEINFQHIICIRNEDDLKKNGFVYVGDL